MFPIKFSSFFTKVKVQNQLLLIFLFAILLPTVTISIYLVYNSRALLLNHYEEQSQSDNTRVKSILLDLTLNIYNKANTLSSDKELVSLLSARYASPKEGSHAAENYENFYILLSQDASIQQISVYTLNETIPDSSYIHPITEEVTKEDWFYQAATTVTPFWTVESEIDRFQNEQKVLCLHTRIFLPQINSYAILNITVSNNHIKNRIENNSLSTILWLNNEKTFYSSQKYTDNSICSSLFSKAKDNTFGIFRLSKQKIIGCLSTLSMYYSNDTFYLASLDYSGYPYTNRINGVYLFILFLILFMSSTLIISYLRYFSRRVITLRETMHQVSTGNYTIVDTFQGTDEISEAFSDLNIMVQDILHKEAEVYQAQLKAKELINQQQQIEFKMLTSQINPHFLYNTLETIRMRSLKAGNHEVANAVKLLGKSMRYVLENTTTSTTTLAKELDYIQTYLAIQRLRFHDKVNYILRIPSDLNLEEYQIMPLLIQPIVENAILHGLEEVEQNGKIIIHIKQKKDRFIIDIFDNGCGMTPDEIKNMEQTIFHHSKESSKSIGLSNIYQRIQLCYGIEYGLTVNSRKNQGTLITLTIPVQKIDSHSANKKG